LINQIDNIDTEQRILVAARVIFQQKGFSGARMDSIAQEAGVNKAMLHYYFRSKEKLFDGVFKEALGHFISKVITILDGKLPLDLKIYKVVDVYTTMLSNNGHLPLFVLSEIRENPGMAVKMLKAEENKSFQNLALQLKEEYEKGNIVEITVYEFFVNLVSLTVFPFLVRPLMEDVFGLEVVKFDQMILSRRKKVPKMIIEMLRA